MANRDDIEKAVGRLLLARLPGLNLIQETKAALEAGTIGGIVLFKENGATLEQLAGLTSAIIKASYHVPIIATDQEGGAIQRYEHFLSSLPSAMAVAATGNPETAAEIATISALQLKSLGINCLLAPVLDVLSNHLNPVIATRAFSDKPKFVSSFGNHVLKAITSCGIVPVGKHFPGHGSTLEDSHTDLATNPAEPADLWQKDLAPFKDCLANMPAILTAHVWLKAVDEEPIPASLSKRVTKAILRDFLDYQGVVMTDDLTMKAITQKWGLEEAALLALEAGNDIIMVCAGISETLSVQKHIVSAVREGRIPEEQIYKSVERVDALFSERLKGAEEGEIAALSKSIQEANSVSRDASQRAICQLRGKLPEIVAGEWMVVAPEHPRYSVDLAAKLQSLLEQSGKKRPDNLKFTELRYSLNPSLEAAEHLSERCRGRNCIFLTYRSLLYEGQLSLGKLLEEKCLSRLAIAIDVPFDIFGFQGWENYLATFDVSDQAMQALALAVLGEAPLTGQCPVKLEFQSPSFVKSDHPYTIGG